MYHTAQRRLFQDGELGVPSKVNQPKYFITLAKRNEQVHDYAGKSTHVHNETERQGGTKGMLLNLYKKL